MWHHFHSNSCSLRCLQVTILCKEIFVIVIVSIYHFTTYHQCNDWWTNEDMRRVYSLWFKVQYSLAVITVHGQVAEHARYAPVFLRTTVSKWLLPLGRLVNVLTYLRGRTELWNSSGRMISMSTPLHHTRQYTARRLAEASTTNVAMGGWLSKGNSRIYVRQPGEEVRFDDHQSVSTNAFYCLVCQICASYNATFDRDSSNVEIYTCP